MSTWRSTKDLLQGQISKDQSSIKVEVGKVLAMLVLESKQNCDQIAKEIGLFEQLGSSDSLIKDFEELVELCQDCMLLLVERSL